MLIDAKDFFTDGQEAKRKQIPILVMFSSSDCPYCELLKCEVIEPMSELQEYQDKVILRHIDYDSEKQVIDFSGKKSTHVKFNDDYDVNFYPILILLDDKGNELETKVGVVLIEYYWTELDALIEKATKQMREIL
ncbi:hypothetical protein SPBRAN_1996 [uncultured Candidatus Thioglobus sp.]|nr:hypothetical protein SPBRAN_1996 [uncultured Candidatus Thioglobus sp.]